MLSNFITLNGIKKKQVGLRFVYGVGIVSLLSLINVQCFAQIVTEKSISGKIENHRLLLSAELPGPDQYFSTLEGPSVNRLKNGQWLGLCSRLRACQMGRGRWRTTPKRKSERLRKRGSDNLILTALHRLSHGGGATTRWRGGRWVSRRTDIIPLAARQSAISRPPKQLVCSRCAPRIRKDMMCLWLHGGP